MTAVKTKKQIAQKSVLQKENLNLRIIKTVQKQLKRRIKLRILRIKYLEKKKKINTDILNKNHKEFIRSNKSIVKTQQGTMF